jgi:hypothetical protein
LLFLWNVYEGGIMKLKKDEIGIWIIDRCGTQMYLDEKEVD